MSESVIRKVRSARWRLNVARFLGSAVWSLTATLFAGAVIVFADKLLHFHWGFGAVLGGSIGAGLLVAGLVTWRRRRSLRDAAIEFDRAFGLNERVSTLLALDTSALDQPAGRALQQDVGRRVENLSVSERIAVGWPRLGWLPAVPLAGLLVIGYLVGPLDWLEPASARATSARDREHVVRQARLLEKKIAERKQEAAEAGVAEELDELTAGLEKTARKLREQDAFDAKEAALELSDLAQSIEERRKRMESTDMVRRALEKMPNLEEGPAQKMANALKKGDFQEAAKQIEALKKQLEAGTLDPAKRAELAKQLEKLQEQLQQLSNLSERARQLRESLPPEQLAQELKKLAQDAEKLEKLKQLAEKLGQCAKCSGTESENDAIDKAYGEAKDLLDELMRDELAREMIDNMLADVAQCRGGLCRGDEGDRPGDGMGPGSGKGDRPIAPDETASRRTRAKSKLTKGAVTFAGRTDGDAFRGDSVLELRAAAAEAARAADDAVTRQKVPRDYKDHARDYFEKLHEGLGKE